MKEPTRARSLNNAYQLAAKRRLDYYQRVMELISERFVTGPRLLVVRRDEVVKYVAARLHREASPPLRAEVKEVATVLLGWAAIAPANKRLFAGVRDLEVSESDQKRASLALRGRKP